MAQSKLSFQTSIINLTIISLPMDEKNYRLIMKSYGVDWYLLNIAFKDKKLNTKKSFNF